MFVSKPSVSEYGPLAVLAGTWEGDKGIDISPSPDGPAETRYRERLVFEPMAPVRNGLQELNGLRYSTTVWGLDSGDVIHEENGYWLRDPASQLIMRCFTVPRGVTVIAGGFATDTADIIEMSAEAEADTFGILSSPYLLDAAKTIYYGLRVNIHDEDAFSYMEDTVLRIHGQEDLFHHTDQNSLKRVCP